MTDSPLSSKKYEDIVASSSALILHNRPANLPAKSVDEEQKHRLEYQQMVEAAKKKGKAGVCVRSLLDHSRIQSKG